jgi:endoglucanase
MNHGTDRAARRGLGSIALFSFVLLLGAWMGTAPAQAAGTGYWHTGGNQILDANNQPVRIAAINWYGFETTTFVAHGLWINDYKAILNLIKSSGFNTVRIPYSDQMVSQNPVLGTLNINRNGINTDIPANATALDVLDRIIAHCGTIGLRVMLDNHRSNAGNSAQENGLWYTNEYPESTWLANWRALTTRYLGNTTVVAMDLRNEPHASACWGGDPAGCSAANDWHAAATRAGNAILAINPNLLIVVEGHDRYNNSFTWWGGMLRGVATRPVVLNVANRLVYSAHDYGPTEASQPWFNGSATVSSLNAIKDQNWGFIYNNNTAPMFVGEFGTLNGNADVSSTTPGSQGQWFSATVAYFQQKPWMSHAYWAMNGNDRYALFNTNFNGVVNQSKLSLLQTIQFPLDQQPGNTPAISGVAPTAGFAGNTITISGSNFGTTQGTSVVRFGTSSASVSSWSASQISVTVPNVAAGPYSVTVTVNGVSSNASTFNVVAPEPSPQIGSLSPTSGAVGTSVTISGSNFGTTQGASTLRFRTTNAAVTSWSNTQIVATVPNIATGAAAVTVTVNGVVSNGPNYTITAVAPTPAIASLNPNSGFVGSSVTVTGSNFGASQGASTLRFGTTAASVSSWSNTSIVAAVPNVTAGSQPVTVTVNGATSGASAFTVTAVTQPSFVFQCPSGLVVTRGAAGSSGACTIARSGGFTGPVTFAAGTTPSGVTISFSPASTTGNSTTMTITAAASASIADYTVVLTATSSLAPRAQQIAFRVTGTTPNPGTVTATGAVASNSPWFAEEQVRLANTAPLTALTVTVVVARTPSSLTSGGQYNTIGGSAISQSVSTTSTQVIYTWTLASGQTLAAGTGRTFAAQFSPQGTAHPTTGDTWTVTYTSGGTATTLSGGF